MSDLTTNTNAECALLGCLLMDEKREYFPAVRAIIKDQYYFSKIENRILFDILCGLADSTDGILDLVRVRDALKTQGAIDAVGGIEYVISLAETTPTAANAEHYAKCVQTAYKRRRIAEHGEALQRAATDPGDVQAALQAAQGDLHELAADVCDKTPIDGAAAVESLILDSIEQRRQIIRMPWSITSKLTNALQGGTVSAFCGGIGASKTFAKQQLTAFVNESGIPAATFELEDNQAFHLTRMLAQKTELPGLTDPDWIAANPEISKAAHSENADWLRRMGKMIDADGGGLVTYDTLTSWALQRARAGCKLLSIDPVTAILHKTPQSWQEDNAFLQKIKRIATDYGVAVLLITHSSKAMITPGLESLAGGAAFGRFSQTVVWIEAHEAKTSDVRYSTGTMPTSHNRSIHLLKTRLGKGQGLRIAATFTDTLKLNEHGVIVKKQKSE